MRAPQDPVTPQANLCSPFLTVQPVDSPDLILRNGLFPGQGGVDVHEGAGVQRVHEPQRVSDFVSCDVDQVGEPDAWKGNGKPAAWNG